MNPTRREALKSCLAAAVGLPLATTREKTMENTTANPTTTLRRREAAPPTEPESTSEANDNGCDNIVPCIRRNDPRCERLVILANALRTDCHKLLDEHGADCACDSCEAAAAARWYLEVLESCFEGQLTPFWFFGLTPGQPKGAADVAANLDLPVAMVEGFVESYA